MGNRSRDSDFLYRIGVGSLGLLVCLAMGGCTSSDRETAPVSGQITLDGKPLAGGSIVCQPIAPPGSVIAGKGSGGVCDADGRFTLETLDRKPGAVVGEHRVRIYGPRVEKSPPKDGDGVKAREIVPFRYNHNTELTLTVPAEGTTTADFKLLSK